MRVAIVLSTNAFENHFGDHMGLSLDDYVEHYANDWSFEYARALRDAGHRATIVMPSTAIAARYDVPSGAADGVTLSFTPVGRITRSLPEQFRRSEVGRYLYSAVYSRSLRPVLSEFDAVYVQEYADGRCAYLLARLPVEMPVVAAHHGALVTRFSSACLRLVTRSGRRQVVFTAQLPPECARLRVALPGRSVVQIPNSFDETVFNLERSAGGRAGLIWVGRFSETQKSFTSLLRALATMPPAEWAPLVVVGDGSDAALYRSMARQLGLDPHIEWQGFVRQRERLAEHLGAARLFVSTSRHEAFALTVLEALACGTPVVASDIEAHRAVVAKGIALFPWNDTQGLVSALRHGFRSADSTAQAIVEDRPEFEHRYSNRSLGRALDGMLRSLTGAGIG